LLLSFNSWQNLFGGVGSAIVVLKRLGIAVSKFIHVEHDKVAAHVCRWNHDPNYLNSVERRIRLNDERHQNNSIQTSYEYFETFEEFVKTNRTRNDQSM
jgi:hypothetical protein